MNKTKSFIKTIVIALAIMLAVAIPFAITGAWYLATRSATGTITLNDGIVIDYSGFGEGSGVWENNATFLLFSSQENIMPGTTIALNDSKIKANSSSAAFFGRVKFSYKFFTDKNGDNEVTNQIVDYSAFVNTPSFASGWVDGNSGDGYYYYATGTTFNALPTNDYVDIFVANSTITLDGNAPGFDHEGGGYQYSNEILIKRIEVYLVFEAYQADATAAANAGWTIVPPPEQYTDAAGVVYTQNQDETWTLTDGTALSANSSNTTATYAARAFDSSYSYTILSTINNQDVVAIGDCAFLNASQLTAVEIPTTISTIGSRAFEGTGLTTVTLPESVEAVGADALAANSLTEVTIENDQAVVTGIDSSGIVENAIMYVPQSVLSNYEENTPTLLAKGVELRGVAAAVTLTAVRSDNDDYGYYMATDSNGNVWYFNLGSFGYGPSWNQHIGPYSSSSEYFNYSWNTDNTNGTQAVITQFLRYDWITSLYEYSDLAVVVPSFFTSNLFSGAKSVTGLGIGLDYGVYPFSNDYKICSVTLPNTLIGIGEYFFRYYSGLNIIIPSSVKIICDNAFQDSSITSIDISSVEYLGYCIFERCTNLQEITLSNSLTYIPSTILYDCTSLTSITLPSTITKIDIAAFDGCSELANITIDSSTIAALDESNSCLLDYATTVYVLNGLTVGDYIGEWGHTTQSDKAGYVKYVKNS